MVDKYLPSKEIALNNRKVTRPWLVGLASLFFGPSSFFFSFRQRNRDYFITYLFISFIVIGFRFIFPTPPLKGSYFIPFINFLFYYPFGPGFIHAFAQWQVANLTKENAIEFKNIDLKKKNLFEIPLIWALDKVESFATRFPEQETIERLGNIFNLTVTASENIYEEAKKVAKRRGKSTPNLDDINKILSESSLQRLTFNEMGGLSIDYEYKEPQQSKRKDLLKEKGEIKKDSKKIVPKKISNLKGNNALSNLSGEIEKLAALKEKGILTDEEFSAAKAKILNS